MLPRFLFLSVVGLFLSASALSAQPAAPAASAPAAATGVEVEAKLKELVAQPGATIVHLWATWCPNCANEHKNEGWKKIIEANSQTRFVFVTFWNDGTDGREKLAQYGLGAQPNVTILGHPGPRKGADKATALLGVPVTWLPSTWVYDKQKLKFALNYGEIRFPILQQLLDDALGKW